MYTLSIEHPVPDYESWKEAFDSDPIGRKKMKVRSYQISRYLDKPNYVVINLEFDSLSDAEAALAALRTLWSRVEGSIMTNPKVQILEIMETKTL